MVAKYFPAFCFASIFVSQSAAIGAGLDKPNLISGRLAGTAGAAVSHVTGPESIFTNPSGLVRSKGTEVVLDFTAGFSNSSAPLISTTGSMNQGAPVRETGTKLSQLGGIFAAHRLNERIAVGAGLFIAGGSGADYGAQDAGALFPSLKPEIKSAIGLLEASVGGAYELTSGFRLGAAWRASLIKIDSRAAVLTDANGDGTADALLATQFTDLTGTTFTGLRFGGQFQPPESHWGLGAQMRTAVNFEAKGNSAGSFEMAGAATDSPLTGGKITLGGTFPFQIALGGHLDMNPLTRLILEYSFTWNASIASFSAAGDPLTGAGLGSIPASQFSFAPGWSNQHLIRIGGERKLTEQFTFRAGYAWASQVMPNDRPNPFFPPAGVEQLISVGVGTQILDKATRLDIAVDYDWISATARGSTPGYLNGDYNLRALGCYLSLSRQF